MNTITATTTTPVAAPRDTGPLSRALGAEWIKLRTLRSTWTTLVGASVGAVALGAIVALSHVAQWDQMTATQRADFDPISGALVGVLLSTVIIGGLGIRSVTSENSNGMVHVTDAALPRRRLVLTAKAAVLVAVAVPSALIANIAAFVIVQRLLAGKHITIDLADAGAARAIVLGALAVGLISVMAVGLGSILRRTGAATALLSMMIIGGQLISVALPEGARRYLPSAALQAAVSGDNATDVLAPLGGLAVLAAITAGVFIVGLVTADRER